MDKIARIRQEIERLKKYYAECGYPGMGEYEQGNKQGHMDTLDNLLSFLDSLQEETQTTYNGMVDEDSFLQLTNGEFIDLCPGLDRTALGLKPGDKVKLIIVKEQ